MDAIGRLPVVLDGEHGYLPRPALANLLLGKASAYTEVGEDPRRSRHLDDLATLASLVSGDDLASVAAAGALHRDRLALCLGIMQTHTGAWQASDAAKAGLDRLRITVDGDPGTCP